ncbi:flagellar biosynthetic protein [Buchnera aphidicola (Nipponaphis monzeni)]|uniref:Flagellar biosynthetic protein FliP n=1 Tax=Buchnera aphidicola (Nipponaphis monzeni) TaxID=2495405 RepID=A0A455T9T6_9GAMM|nr:flagellar type III secretion system pore protein FliP [Buchnera aphidicola]BBI01083.1 flagellar biosynthetic protein [Buchnera aphidicola (Nipponaphis monzeni)]
MIYYKLLLFIPLLIPPIVHSSMYQLMDNFSSKIGNNWSFSTETLVLFIILSFIPMMVLMMTCFTRIIIVFNLLRNALGTPYSPPNQIILGLSLFLTFFIMSPVFDTIYQKSYVPYYEKKINLEEALQVGLKPIRSFMLKQIKKPDLELFTHLSNINTFQTEEDIPLQILLPSFVISELKTAFQIGFIIYIPFLIIDLIVASVLMALGMMMIPPATVSLPFKLMLFVLVDGWNLLINALVQSVHV